MMNRLARRSTKIRPLQSTDDQHELMMIKPREGMQFLSSEHTSHFSLEKVLHTPHTTVILNWETRINICLEIAKGLRDLHSISIVHGNIESSNIMLEPFHLKPKISNIGFINDAQEKVDVYNYGVLVFEIISGNREDYNHVSQLVASNLHANESLLLDFVDKRLTNYECYNQQLIALLKLAIMCTNDSP